MFRYFPPAVSPTDITAQPRTLFVHYLYLQTEINYISLSLFQSVLSSTPNRPPTSNWIQKIWTYFSYRLQRSTNLWAHQTVPLYLVPRRREYAAFHFLATKLTYLLKPSARKTQSAKVITCWVAGIITHTSKCMDEITTDRGNKVHFGETPPPPRCCRGTAISIPQRARACVALVIQHARRMRGIIILSSVAWVAPPHFSTLFYTR
jgi:hypothetical protein